VDDGVRVPAAVLKEEAATTTTIWR